MKFRSGVLGSVQWCFVVSDQAKEDVVEIIGTKGKVVFRIFAFTPIQLVSESRNVSYSIFPPEHIQQPLITTIVEELRGEGNSPSTGITGARTSKVMDWIMNSI